ncbi:MAG: exodeoxyribonuclease V subunit gamma [Rhabdochlamydiaceae bacterium]|jgi:exonuclease V gamma subunit
MQIFLSNRLEVLADALRDVLFSSHNPFAIQHVIVPTHHLKNFLLYRWAKDKKLQIVAGIKILTLAEALRLFFPNIPTSVELSLQIEEYLTNHQDTQPVADYLKQGGPKRLGSLADQISSLFLTYGICEKEVLSNWQGKKVGSRRFGNSCGKIVLLGSREKRKRSNPPIPFKFSALFLF